MCTTVAFVIEFLVSGSTVISRAVGSSGQQPTSAKEDLQMIDIYIYTIYIYIVVYIDWLIQIGSSRYSFLMS